MARFSAASRGVTNLPTAVRGPALFASAAGGAFTVREVHVFNTTTSAVAVGVAVCSVQGTGVDGLTEYAEDDPSAPAADETAFKSQSGDSTVTAQVRQASLGAAIGSGIIFTWGERGLLIPEGTGNGIIINCPTGTAQFLDFAFVWDK